MSWEIMPLPSRFVWGSGTYYRRKRWCFGGARNYGSTRRLRVFCSWRISNGYSIEEMALVQWSARCTVLSTFASSSHTLAGNLFLRNYARCGLI
jgi:hypothetical protein